MTSKYKDRILELRKLGYSYTQIRKEIGCSHGIIVFHLGEGQKEKWRKRKCKQHPYMGKMVTFRHRKNNFGNKRKSTATTEKLWREKVRQFFREKYGERKMGKSEFDWHDVMNKFGDNPKCYLTGEEIDIYKPRTYEFDHIIPRSRGGTNSIDNLGLCTKQANRCKSDMTPDEFFNFCKRVLENNGHNVSKKLP